MNAALRRDESLCCNPWIFALVLDRRGTPRIGSVTVTEMGLESGGAVEGKSGLAVINGQAKTR